MKTKVLLTGVLSLFLVISSCSQKDTLILVPVEFDIPLQVAPHIPGTKATQAVIWGTTLFNPFENATIKNYQGSIMSLTAKQIIITPENLPTASPISEARVKFSMPNPTAQQDDPISSRWISAAWYTQNGYLENLVNYSFLPGQDTASWNALSRMLFVSDTINIQWEGWHELVNDPYILNVKVLAEIGLSGP